MFPPCTQSSVLYENVCEVCNPGAKEAKELRSSMKEVPSIYVGESSRSIQERSIEHWSKYRAGSNKSHILKHQDMEHEGAAPQFIMRAVSFHRTALSRQIAEAVRIRRRGGEGAILNSKSEYNRCHIPRLQLEEEEPEGARDTLEQDLAKQIEEEQTQIINNWERIRCHTKSREQKQHLRWSKGAKNRMRREQDGNEPGSDQPKRRKL